MCYYIVVLCIIIIVTIITNTKTDSAGKDAREWYGQLLLIVIVIKTYVKNRWLNFILKKWLTNIRGRSPMPEKLISKTERI